MQVTIFTLFPDFFTTPLATSLLGKAVTDQRIDVSLVDFRDFTQDRHRTVDDAVYGGGPGMLLKPEPLAAAFAAHPVTEGGRRIYLTPSGRPLDQQTVERFAGLPQLQLLCGRYEGVDQRVIDTHIDEEVSLGDFVLAGGEVAALAVVEAVARYVPGVLGASESLDQESHAEGLLEGPHYTRPEIFAGQTVPAVLLSGDHAAIARWRHEQAVERTRRMRPDLYRRWEQARAEVED